MRSYALCYRSCVDPCAQPVGFLGSGATARSRASGAGASTLPRVCSALTALPQRVPSADPTWVGAGPGVRWGLRLRGRRGHRSWVCVDRSLREQPDGGYPRGRAAAEAGASTGGGGVRRDRGEDGVPAACMTVDLLQSPSLDSLACRVHLELLSESSSVLVVNAVAKAYLGTITSRPGGWDLQRGIAGCCRVQ